MFRLILVVVVTFFVHINRAQNLTEGSPCNDKDVKGTCRKAKLCPSSTLLLTKQSDIMLCSKDGKEEIICCTDCYNDGMSNQAAEPILTLDGIVWTTGGNRKSYDKCVQYAAKLPYPCADGIKTTLREGYNATEKCNQIDVSVEQDPLAAMPERVDFPSLALVGFIYNDTELIHWQCQGFIISEWFIVTTAHCGRFVTATGPEIYVAVGIDRRTASDTGAKTETGGSSSRQHYKAKRFIQHPDWDSVQMFNDIGLVETMNEIKFDFNVLPMCFAERSSDTEIVQADILGIENIRSNKMVNLKKLKEKECSKLFSDYDGLKFYTQSCYEGFNEAVDTCMGSTGRPIYVSGALKCVKYVVGLMSFGRSCDHPEVAAIYTRIQDFISWIEGIVWP